MDRIEGLGRPAATAPRVHPLVQRKALVTIPGASRQLGLSQPTVTSVGCGNPVVTSNAPPQLPGGTNIVTAFLTQYPGRIST